MKKRILNVLLTYCIVIIVFAILPATAMATDSGTCGDNLTWTLEDNGTLTIAGTGDMASYASSESTPWYYNRESVIKVVIKEGVTSIGSHAFNFCVNLTSITIPNSITSIGWSAFNYCSNLTNITIPSSVTSIGNFAFDFCENLTSITIPSSVTTIGRYAFSQSGLTSVTIPASVSSIGDRAFSGCLSLRAIAVDSKNLYYTNDSSGVLFDKQKSTLIQYPSGNSSTSYTIPNSVSTIGNDAFSYCTSLSNITIPNSVTSIGYDAFLKCTGLTSMEIPNSVTLIKSTAFKQCTNLTNITLPDSITTIDAYLFCSCNSLTSISIPDNITSIGNYAFEDCINLISISIPDSLTSIGYAAFRGCDNLNDIYYDGSNWNSITIGEDNEDLTSATIHYKYGPLVKDGTFSYLGYDNGVHNYKYHYDESWFFNSSYNYQHDLTRMSLRVAMAAGDIRVADGKAGADGAAPLKKLMGDLGFTYSEKFSHYPIPEYDSIGYGIGSKTITSLSGDQSTLVMVAVRGSGYGAEWGGNFRIGSGTDHQGFQIAANQVVQGIKDYIDANNFQSEIKIWISGYSRAAATVNLVAKLLVDNQYFDTSSTPGTVKPYIPNFSPSNLYAFCFECPQNTTAGNTNNQQYRNIVNIVNPIDIVPKVAMSAWGFRRYGTTYYLPSAESSSQYSALKSRMATEYKKILNYFEFGTGNQLILNSEFLQEANAQASIFDRFVNNLAVQAQDRVHYKNVYQQTIMDTAVKAMVSGSQADLNLGNAFLCIAEILPNLDRMVSSDLIQSMKHLGPAHYMELCLAWLDAVDTIAPGTYNTCRKVFINCPVDVLVYDSEQNLVAKIIDDEAQSIENGVPVYLDNNGQKVIILPTDGEYDIQVSATGDGTMTYTVTEYDIETSQSQRVVSYQEIEIAPGDELRGIVEDLETVSEADYSFVLTDGEPAVPTVDQTGDEVVSFTVMASAAEGGTVAGGGSFVSGEYAKVIAIADPYYYFDGWYEGDERVSSDAEYRFLISENIELTAKFKAYNFSLLNIAAPTTSTAVDIQLLAEQDCTLMVALYTDKGKMIHVGLASVTGKAEEQEISVSVPTSASHYHTVKAFLLDYQRYRPLCEKCCNNMTDSGSAK